MTVVTLDTSQADQKDSGSTVEMMGAMMDAVQVVMSVE